MTLRFRDKNLNKEQIKTMKKEKPLQPRNVIKYSIIRKRKKHLETYFLIYSKKEIISCPRRTII